MKKLGAFLILLILIFGGLFLFLLSKTGPEHANTEVKTIEIEDTFER